MQYTSTLSLIEPTKLLERIPVDNRRFLNPLGHDYTKGAYTISPQEYEPTNDVDYQFATYTQFMPTPITTNKKNTLFKNVCASNGTLDIYELCYWSNYAEPSIYEPQETSIEVQDPEGTTIYTGKATKTTGNVIASVRLSQVGNHKVIYKVAYGNEYFTATYTIYAVTNTQAKQPYTITGVIKSILNASLGTMNGYFTLDPDIASAWDKIQAPEFEITGKNLFEALSIVGGYKDIQAIPRLLPNPNGNDWEYNYITFDILNSKSEWTKSSLYIDYQSEQLAENYCGGFESYVDNFVDQSQNGVVGYNFPKTVRTETTDLIISDNYAIIKTSQPIYRVDKLSQAFINSSGTQVGDITAYVFEKSEYDNLTKYKGEYPTAKQFAFYYIQGQPNIYGLVLKPETATSIGLALQEFSAVQVAERKSGQQANTSNGVCSFAYTIKYTPITRRR